jgi:hypothetical protein
MHSKADRDRIAIELKKWLRSHSLYRKVADLQAPTGIPYASLKDYFQGRSIPSGDRLERLAAFTGLPSLRALLNPLPTSAGSASPSNDKARSVAITVHHLLTQLNFFKRGTSADRDVLRNTLPARDVGYLTTLLKAMYEEDQFQNWVYFSEYSPEQK